MGSCIICGTSVDGRVCELHEEDVGFEFRGTDPDELTSERYYRGTVDGYAEFGVFVDIGDSVTGLLHRSEIDQRLESLPHEPGDELFVKVQNVRSNGNVDLSWSIRQEPAAFRGMLIDDPDGEERLLEETTGGDSGADASVGSPTTVPSPDEQTDEDDAEPTRASDSSDAVETRGAEPAVGPETARLDRLAEHEDDPVEFDARVEDVRQTSGPTVFTVSDETGEIECAAFDGAGVRAYPAVEAGDVVRIVGVPERRRGDLQVEVESLDALADDERATFLDRLETALTDRARPDSVEPIAEDPAVADATEALEAVATELRRAVFEGRPIVVRHAATVDGYAASVALERAVLPLVRAHHDDPDAEYHYFDRRPVEGTVYDMDDATRDVTRMLSAQDRHDEAIPLFVFVAAGGTAESADGFDLLGVYDATRVILDAGAIPATVEDCSELLAGPADTTTTALAAAVAAGVADDDAVRAEIAHLPAVSFWEETPDGYRSAAADAGYEPDVVAMLREAVALEAFYQSYEDKRELIADLLFAAEDQDPAALAGHIGEQFRTRMQTAVETAEANLERHALGEATALVLDTEAYTHRYEFPPDRLLVEELFRRHRDEAAAVVGLGRDEARIRTDADVDLRGLFEAAGRRAPAAALDARGARDGRVEFLAGEREAAREALLEATAEALA